MLPKAKGAQRVELAADGFTDCALPSNPRFVSCAPAFFRAAKTHDGLFASGEAALAERAWEQCPSIHCVAAPWQSCSLAPPVKPPPVPQLEAPINGCHADCGSKTSTGRRIDFVVDQVHKLLQHVDEKLAILAGEHRKVAHAMSKVEVNVEALSNQGRGTVRSGRRNYSRPRKTGSLRGSALRFQGTDTYCVTETGARLASRMQDEFNASSISKSPRTTLLNGSNISKSPRTTLGPRGPSTRSVSSAFQLDAFASQHPERPSSMAESDGSSASTHEVVIRSRESTEGWPRNIRLREIPDNGIDSASENLDMLMESVMQEATSGTNSSVTSEETFAASANRRRRWQHILPIHPHSTSRVAFDSIGLLVLLFDQLVLPIRLAWDLTFDGLLAALVLICRLFWPIDMGCSFVTGFYDRGELVMNCRSVALHYLRTWFCPDLIMIICDWLDVIVDLMGGQGAQGGHSKVLRFGKSLRLLRILAVLRSMKAWRAVQDMFSRTHSEYVRVMAQVTKIVLGLLWLCHVAACAWYAIGTSASSHPGGRWLDEPVSPETIDVVPQPMKVSGGVYQYFVALHWSLCAMAAGNMDITPRNVTERLFNIVCLLFGLILGSLLISTLSAAFVELQNRQEETSHDLMILRAFLKQRDICPTIAFTVQQQIHGRMTRCKPLTLDEVSTLNLLSFSLRVELQYEMCRLHLSRHPIFNLFRKLDLRTTQKLCLDAIVLVALDPGDTLFLTGEEAKQAYIVVRGSLKYSADVGHAEGRKGIFKYGIRGSYTLESNAYQQERIQIAAPGAWLSEAALWTHWAHVGIAEAEHVCELLALDAHKFMASAGRSKILAPVVQQYAKTFHRTLVTHAMGCNLPTDFNVPFTNYVDIVFSMPFEMRAVIGILALAEMKRTALPRTLFVFQREACSERLEKDVRSGVCTLTVNNHGEVERAVAVAAIRLERSGGRILVQLGTKKVDRLDVNCVLPGGKLQEEESPGDAVQRLIRNEMLAELDGTIHLTGHYSEVEWGQSDNYGLRTRYARTVFKGKFKSSSAAVVPPLSPCSEWKVSSAIEVTSQHSSKFKDSVHSSSKESTSSLTGLCGKKWTRELTSLSARRVSKKTSIKSGLTAASSHAMNGAHKIKGHMASLVGAGAPNKHANSPARTLSLIEPIFLRDGKKWCITAWVSVEEFDYLRTANGLTELRQLLENLDMTSYTDALNTPQ